MLAGIDHLLFLRSTVVVSLGGGLCALDRTAVLQGMFSRPLVAATVGGALVGNWEIGLLLGAILELYFLCEIPVGTNIPTDDTILALAAGGVAGALRGVVAFSHINSRSLALVVLVLVLPWSEFTRKLDAWVREWNQGLVDEAETDLLAGRNISAVNLHLRGIANFYGAAIFGLGLMMSVSLGVAVLVLHLLPGWLTPVTDRLLLIFPLVGVAGLLTSMNKRSLFLVFVAAAACLLVL